MNKLRESYIFRTENASFPMVFRRICKGTALTRFSCVQNASGDQEYCVLNIRVPIIPLWIHNTLPNALNPSESRRKTSENRRNRRKIQLSPKNAPTSVSDITAEGAARYVVHNTSSEPDKYFSFNIVSECDGKPLECVGNHRNSSETFGIRRKTHRNPLKFRDGIRDPPELYRNPQKLVETMFGCTTLLLAYYHSQNHLKNSITHRTRALQLVFCQEVNHK